jgi:hypothetical protein
MMEQGQKAPKTLFLNPGLSDEETTKKIPTPALSLFWKLL